MRREAELEEIKASLDETLYKVRRVLLDRVIATTNSLIAQ
jgi:hypothetical protein